MEIKRQVSKDIQDRVYENLFKIYNSKKDTMEIEYRFKINRETIQDILNQMSSQWKDKFKFEQSVELKYQSTTKKNRTIKQEDITAKYYFDNGVIVKTEYYKKERKGYILFDDIPVKLSVAEESSALKSHVKGNPVFCRIKNRIMINDGPYRYDFTIVSQLDKTTLTLNKNIIQTIRTRLFSIADSYQSFISSISNTEFNIEFEIEIKPKSYTDIKLDSIYKKIPPLTSMLAYKSTLEEIAELLHYKSKNISLKAITSKVVSLSKDEYSQIYPPINFYVTHKADGERCLIFVKRNIAYIILSKTLIEVKLENKLNNTTTIIEGEYMEDKKTILLYDCLVFDSNIMIFSELSERLSKTSQWASEFNNGERGTMEFKVEVKQFFIITEDLTESFNTALRHNFKYKSDGFIMVEKKGYYNSKQYKIKNENTIDFLAVKLPDKLVKDTYFPPKLNHDIYILFSGVSKNIFESFSYTFMKYYEQILQTKYRGNVLPDYLPIQFSPPDTVQAYIWYLKKGSKEEKDLLANKGMFSDPSKKEWYYVELLPEFDKNGSFINWKYVGTRTDRVGEPNYFGNDHKLAVSNWLIQQDRINLENMDKPPDMYFSHKKTHIYKAQTNALSFVKSSIISSMSEQAPNLFVMDLAAGKGQDLHRYIDFNYDKGLFLDIDRVAIYKLIYKRYDLMKSNYYKSKNFEMYAGVQDLNKPYSETYDKLKAFFKEDKPGFINCNLAIHYLVGSLPQILNIVNLVKMCLHDRGYFVYTCFSGAHINELLTDKDEWVHYEKETLKYKITKNYKGNELSEFGQKISVKLPFSDELYEENLVNIEFLNKQFIKAGFEVISTGSFEKYFTEIKRDRMDLYKKLSEEDKLYIGLYHYVILKRV